MRNTKLSVLRRISNWGVPGVCWEWTGTILQSGYGQVTVAGQRYRAHRYAYELFVGPIPEGMLVCHRCDNPPCCNPSHLFLGTAKANQDDRNAKGRGPQGERNPNVKLTLQQVAELRARYAAGGVRQVDLAAEYGISQNAVSRITRGLSWAS